MAEPIIVRQPMFAEILWRLPQNVYQRRRSISIVGGAPGHLKDMADVAEIIITLPLKSLTLGLPQGLAEGLPSIPDVLIQALPETITGTLAKTAKEGILALTAAADLTVLGPFISKNPETIQLVQEIVPQIEKPILLVGDAIDEVTILLLHGRQASTLLVGDIGAIARLMKRSDSRLAGNVVSTLYKDYKTVLPDLAKKAGTHIITISPEAMVVSPDDRLAIIPNLAPDLLAKYMTVLTGLVAGITAHQPTKAFESSVIAYEILRTLAERKYLDGTRRDLLAAIPKTMNELAA